jgi:hypothetical protein
MTIDLETLTGEWARAHTSDGALLALLHRTGAQWHPQKVFNQP